MEGRASGSAKHNASGGGAVKVNEVTGAVEEVIDNNENEKNEDKEAKKSTEQDAG